MSNIRVLHVSNISPFATKEQIQTLFAYVGRIEEFKLYPSDFVLAQTSQQPKFAYIKFEDSSGVDVGQHLTNTVFLDRALVCVPTTSNSIPDEETALQGGSLALPGQRQLPPHISNQIQDIGDGQKMIVTIDPTFASLGLPTYPPLPPTTEPSKVEEIRRTVYVGNLPKGCDGEGLLNFFNACIGEVMYLRMAAGNEYLPCDYAYVEFSQQSSVPLALQNSDSLEFQGRVLRIQHSKVAIIKPQRKTAEQSLEEVEEAIRGGAIGGAMDLGRGYSPHRAGATTAAASSTAQAQSTLRDSPASSTRRRTRSRSTRRSHSRNRRRSRSRSRSSSYSRRRRRRSRSRTPAERSSRKRRSSSTRRRSRSKKRSVDRSKKKKRSRSRERSTREESSAGGKSSKRDKEREKERERGSSRKDKEGSSSKKDRKRSRSRSSAKKVKSAEREEKSNKKSKRSSEDSSKKVKKEVATDSEPPSTRTEASEVPPAMDISSPKKPPKSEPIEMEEEETLRERLLERVKIKHQQKESDD